MLQRRDRWMVVAARVEHAGTPARRFVRQLQVDSAFIDFSRCAARARCRAMWSSCAKQEPKAGRDGGRHHARYSRQSWPALLHSRCGIGGNGWQASSISQEGQGCCWRRQRTHYRRYLPRVTEQRLQIERGILTFQGPIENPSLKHLATRPGLPVEVGVRLAVPRRDRSYGSIRTPSM